jgi:hypothetical protein
MKYESPAKAGLFCSYQHTHRPATDQALAKAVLFEHRSGLLPTPTRKGIKLRREGWDARIEAERADRHVSTEPQHHALCRPASSLCLADDLGGFLQHHQHTGEVRAALEHAPALRHHGIGTLFFGALRVFFDSVER